MTFDALIARMTQDAQARIAQLRDAADAEVAALQQDSAAASSRDVEAVLAARRADRERAFALDRALAQRSAAAAALSAQHALLDRVWTRAEVLGAQAGADTLLVQALPRLVATVLPYLGGRPATLRCRPDLLAHLQPLLAAAPQTEAVADARLPAGFVARTDDERCTIDCTLPARLAALRPRLEAAVLAQVPT